MAAPQFAERVVREEVEFFLIYPDQPQAVPARRASCGSLFVSRKTVLRLSESCEPIPQFPWGSPPLEKNSFVTSRSFILRSELFTRGQDVSIRFPMPNLFRPLRVVAAASWHRSLLQRRRQRQAWQVGTRVTPFLAPQERLRAAQRGSPEALPEARYLRHLLRPHKARFKHRP